MGATTRHTQMFYSETVREEDPKGLDESAFPGAVEHDPCEILDHVDDEDRRDPEREDARDPEWDDGLPFAGVDPERLSRHELGMLGEEVAARELARMGYEILDRNYRCREGEADIVAYDLVDDVVVLVEVKTRRAGTVSDGTYAEEAVDARKRRRYRRIASCYLMENFPTRSIRFDVMAVTVNPDRTAEVHHVVAAFDWDADR